MAGCRLQNSKLLYSKLETWHFSWPPHQHATWCTKSVDIVWVSWNINMCGLKNIKTRVVRIIDVGRETVEVGRRHDRFVILSRASLILEILLCQSKHRHPPCRKPRVSRLNILTPYSCSSHGCGRNKIWDSANIAVLESGISVAFRLTHRANWPSEEMTTSDTK